MLSPKQSAVGAPHAILTIAGSDPSGGAGIQVRIIEKVIMARRSNICQADIKTFTALGCYGTSVVTALTAQNTIGVQAVHAPPPEFVEQQVGAVSTSRFFASGLASHNFRYPLS
jgi:hydroxymethylpyrimidine/phosphomethylpyrimidine kinase